MTANDVIQHFDLKPLPEEGGFYRETFRDAAFISASALPDHGGKRCSSTAIFYLITPEEFSGLHAVKSSELFHFYAGDPVEMVQITDDGVLTYHTLGSDWVENQSPQVSVPPYIWQGTRLKSGGQWALLGCTVAPGFEFADFITADRETLVSRFPQHQSVIQLYTRETL